MPRMSIADIEALMDEGFPDWRKLSEITELGERDITLRMPYRPGLTRAGGTISGPAMMALADTAAYFVTLAHAGPPAATSATANLDIHFLSRPKPADVTAVATMLRLGRRLAVTRVELFSDAELVAHATVSYALPSR